MAAAGSALDVVWVRVEGRSGSGCRDGVISCTRWLVEGMSSAQRGRGGRYRCSSLLSMGLQTRGNWHGVWYLNFKSCVEITFLNCTKYK